MFITCPVTSGHLLFFPHQVNSKLFFSNKILLQSASRPAWEVIFCVCARPSGSSSDLLKSWGGGSVAVACGARLSCSVFMVYSVLLSVSLVAHAPI